MKVLVTGCRGMLGRTLMRSLTGHELTGTDIEECDITSPAQVRLMMERHRPDCVMHCAAWTAVDECEADSDRAFAVNALGSANVAAACHAVSARLIAISTDYVFSGQAGRPCHEWDAPDPRTVYGRSKLAGERMVRELCPDHVIARTAWLYGPGGPSFVHTMLRLSSQPGPPIRVVNDQVGCPTSTLALADAVARLLETPLSGTVHLACDGQASWCDLAQEVFALAGRDRCIEPCTTAEMPRPAPRPADSRLESLLATHAGLEPMPNWRESLARFFREYPDG